jgi:hypothetical protein
MGSRGAGRAGNGHWVGKRGACWNVNNDAPFCKGYEVRWIETAQLSTCVRSRRR